MAAKGISAMVARDVEVKRLALIETLRANKEKHLREYKEALDGYKDEARKKLTEYGDEARRKLEKNLQYIADEIEQFSPETVGRFSDHFVLVQQVAMNMPVPKNYADAYDAAIDLAKWDVNETMKLSFAEFQCFVRDEWDWKSAFEATNILYSKKA